MKCKGVDFERDETQIFIVDFLVMINYVKTGFIEMKFRKYLFSSAL